MRVTRTIDELRAARGELGGRVAFVPTMGALHAGHLSLVAEARRRGDHTLASVFVNPTQFNDPADLAAYPRPIDDDLAKLDEAGVDVAFVPAAEALYRAGEPEVVVDVPALTGVLEGRHRPGHFRGVCRVVLKLLNLARPDVAVFGEKDYQQLRVIEAMAAGLDLGVEVVGCPTLREPDGLAMSSRNARLSADERRRAASIRRGLLAAREEHAAGVTQANRLVATVQRHLLDRGDLGHVPVNIDYVAAVDARTLEDVQTIEDRTLVAVAARVGDVRLIDNLLLS